MAVAPIAILCILIAAVILPAEHQTALRVIEFVIIPVELAVTGWIGLRAIRTLKEIRGQEIDPLVALQAEDDPRLSTAPMRREARSLGIFVDEPVELARALDASPRDDR